LTIASTNLARYNGIMTSIRLSPPRCGACCAFSLIELLITLAIIIILSVMLWGFGSRRNQLSKMQQCQANLQKVYISAQIYANEHDDWFPLDPNANTSEAALNSLVPKYCADARLFICPGSKDEVPDSDASLEQIRISYAYYMGRKQGDPTDPFLSDRQVDTRPKLAHAQVFSEDGKPPGNNHHKYGGVLLYSDGSARSIPADTPVALPTGRNVILLNPKP